MKKMIIALLILALCAILYPTFANTQPDCYEDLAQKTYEKILHLARKDNPDLHTIENTNFIEQQMIILGSINEPEAFKFLIALLDIYTGESNGEILSQIIVEKEKKIIPYLEKALNTQSACDSKLYRCFRNSIKELVEAIKKGAKGESYGAGEPIQYLSADDLKKKCKSVK